MQAVYFLVVAVVLYFVSDWIVNRIEIAIGRRLEQRTLVFFGILLALAITSFWLIRRFAAPA